MYYGPTAGGRRGQRHGLCVWVSGAFERSVQVLQTTEYLHQNRACFFLGQCLVALQPVTDVDRYTVKCYNVTRQRLTSHPGLCHGNTRVQLRRSPHRSRRRRITVLHVGVPYPCGLHIPVSRVLRTTVYAPPTNSMSIGAPSETVSKEVEI